MLYISWNGFALCGLRSLASILVLEGCLHSAVGGGLRGLGSQHRKLLGRVQAQFPGRPLRTVFRPQFLEEVRGAQDSLSSAPGCTP